MHSTDRDHERVSFPRVWLVIPRGAYASVRVSNVLGITLSTPRVEGFEQVYAYEINFQEAFTGCEL